MGSHLNACGTHSPRPAPSSSVGLSRLSPMTTSVQERYRPAPCSSTLCAVRGRSIQLCCKAGHLCPEWQLRLGRLGCAHDSLCTVGYATVFCRPAPLHFDFHRRLGRFLLGLFMGAGAVSPLNGQAGVLCPLRKVEWIAMKKLLGFGKKIAISDVAAKIWLRLA